MENIAQYLSWRAGEALDSQLEIFRALAASQEAGDTVFTAPPSPSPHFRQRGQQTWLRRIWDEEQALARDILGRLRQRPAADVPAEALPRGLNERQQQAFSAARRRQFLIINGGPGTGKTYILAQLVKALRAETPELLIGLCAPTGKAAQRVGESLLREAVAIDNPQTIHRLLHFQGGEALHDEHNPLPHDLLIVDEASMLSSALARQLFGAVRPESRLILLGDAQQLAAVEPGAVLHDLIRAPRLRDFVVTLEESRRFTAASAIGRLVRGLQQAEPEAEALLALCEELNWQEKPSQDELWAGFQGYMAALRHGDPADEATFQAAEAAFNRYRILSSSNHGDFGTVAINRALAERHRRDLGLAYGEFFHGLPLLVTANDYRLELFNGDIGLCWQRAGGLVVRFPGQKTVALNQLNPRQLLPAYALTVHKAQGSEFDEVALVLPAEGPAERLLSRELFYTGVSRARQTVRLFGPRAALRRAIVTPTQRHTGLGFFLQEEE